MIINNKSNNGINGSIFEQIVCNEYNGNIDYNNPMHKGAEKVVKIIKDKFPSLFNAKAEWCGKNTKKADGDIKIADKYIELKDVSSGSGTYLNTSIHSLTKYGLEDFKAKKSRDFLCDFFGKSVYSNSSPLTIQQSKEFRHCYLDKYAELKKVDYEERKEYVDYVYKYFIEHQNICKQFFQDVLTKKISNKKAPDYLIIYNYKKDKINLYTENEILCMKTNNLHKNDVGITYGNIRIEFSWQNGCGCNNPTIRAFLIDK